ncbi:MAG: hypothetical protein C4308_04910 [Chitinophagaceae bacterium]
MKIFLQHIIFLCLPAIASSQAAMKMIAPHHISAGESFQVQYVVQGGSNITNFKLEEFSDVKIITGPVLYPSKNNSKNFVFTVQAKKAGKIILPAATCFADGKKISCRPFTINVSVPDEFAEYGDYFLRAGEEPYQKIKKNLFLKVFVNRTTCFVGQPVVATFKLYSRLQSRSNVIKNPGFYGFSVVDIQDVEDEIAETDEINGRQFDVHTIRKVQLYPLQAGKFIIDAMELENEVEFLKSMVSNKGEQLVEEHMYNRTSKNAEPNIYQTNLASLPVTIDVKPLPANENIENFTGAVGNFNIHVSLPDTVIETSREAALEVILTGRGNFQQLNLPEISWPKGLEGYQLKIIDRLDKEKIPLQGSRCFLFLLNAAKPGKFTIPSIHFSYFNPEKKNYQTDSTQPITIIVAATRQNTSRHLNISKDKTKNNWVLWLASATVIIAGVAGIIFKKRKRKTIMADISQHIPVVAVEELFAPAVETLPEANKIFYSSLNRCTWQWLWLRFAIDGNKISKDQLTGTLMGKGVNHQDAKDLTILLKQNEWEAFTATDSGLIKHEQYNRLITLLKKIDAAGKNHSEYL